MRWPINLYLVMLGLCALVVGIGLWGYHIAPTRRAAAPSTQACAPTGDQGASLDQLRIAAMELDAAIMTGRAPDGNSVPLWQLAEVAENFAQRQASPDETFAQLMYPGSRLLVDYPHGYWMLASALVQELARCREVAQFVDTCGASNDI